MKVLHASVVVVASLLAACVPPTGESLPPPAAGSVVSFIATPATIDPGAEVTLSWQTKDATAVSVAEVGGASLSTELSGSVKVTPSATTLYVITARGAGGTDAKSTQVTVNSNEGTAPLFAAAPQTIAAGDSATLLWNAPGATEVTLKVQGGAEIAIADPKTNGSVQVKPSASTTYELTVDGQTLTAAVAVTPKVFTFALEGPAPKAGEKLTLRWATGGGTGLKLFREGVTDAIYTEADAAKVTAGSFEDTAPADLVTGGVLTYRLELDGSPAAAVATLTVRGGGSVAITTFTLSGYVLAGQAPVATWATSGASALELQLDGQVVFRAPTQDAVNAGTFTLPPPTGPHTLTIIARNANGAEARQSKPIAVVGEPTFVSFTADKTTVAQGGLETVTLSWNVTGAHHVTITETNVGVVYEQTGDLSTGMTTVLPNQASTVYTLTADNGVDANGTNAIAPQTVTVTVTTVSVITFSTRGPAGSATTITGTNVPGATRLEGMPVSIKNRPGEAFVDISTTGTNALGTTFLSTSSLAITIPSFPTRIYGEAVDVPALAVSPNGFFAFRTTSFSGFDTPSANFATPPMALAIAPYWADLQVDPTLGSAVYWQIDTVNGEKRLIVQWHNAQRATDTANSRLTFQAQVYQSGKIVFAYAPFTATPTLDGVIGVVNGTNTGAISVGAGAMTSTTDTFTFFTDVPLPLTTPIPYTIGNAPLVGKVYTANGSFQIMGDPRYVPGEFAITEANPNPAAAVTDGEWVEVTNFSAQPVDLSGWSLDFGTAATNKFAIPMGTTLPANGRLLFGQSAGAGEGAPMGVVYGNAAGLAMSNTSGSVTLSKGTAAYSRLSYSATTQGTSIKADPPRTGVLYVATTTLQASCAGTGTYGANGQIGSPGAANVGRCFGYDRSTIPAAFESIAATGTMLVNQASPAADLNDKVFAVTLASPARINGAAVSTLSVSTNGWLSPTTTTTVYATNGTAPVVATPVTVAPFWDDLKVNAMSSGIYWERKDPDGTAGSGDEYTIVSWENVAWSSTTVTSSFNFQVKLFDNGNIEYHYGTMSSMGSTVLYHQGASATTWLKNLAGDAALTVNVNSVTPGIAPNSAIRFTAVP